MCLRLHLKVNHSCHYQEMTVNHHTLFNHMNFDLDQKRIPTRVGTLNMQGYTIDLLTTS